MDWLDRLLAQVNTLKELWPSFVIVWAVTGIIIWRVVNWRYQAVIEGLDHRIRLKDDTISHLGRAPPALLEPSPQLEPTETTFAEVGPLPEDPRTVRIAREDRVFIPNRNAPDLMRLLDDNTTMKQDSLARPYIGKWLEVTLPVKNIVQREDETLILFSRPDAIASQIWLHFPGDRERLEILEVGDSLTAVGRITKLSSLIMRLYGCEMVKAA